MDQQLFLARQSILDRNLKLFAYELPFRTSNVNRAVGDMDSVSAAAQVLIHGMEIGVDRLSCGRLVFINLPREVLVDPPLLSLDTVRVMLSIRALAYANSAPNALNRKIDSVRKAAVWLVRELIRKWVVSYSMSGVEGKADEIEGLALVRAHVS